MISEIIGFEYSGAKFTTEEINENELRDIITEDAEKDAEERGHKKASVRSYLRVIRLTYTGGEYVPLRTGGKLGEWRKVKHGATFTRETAARVFVW